jgi:hypothetical protein
MTTVRQFSAGFVELTNAISVAELREHDFRKQRDLFHY